MPDFGDHDPNDEGGRYYQHGAVNPNDPSVANGQITPQQWAEYQARRRRDAILGTLGILGGTIGLGFAGQALGGAGGAAANAAAGAGESLPPIAGGAPWAVTPYAATASMAPTGAAAVGGTIGAGAIGAGAGAGGGAGSGLFSGMSARDIAALGLAGAGTIGGLTQGRNDTSPNSMATDPQMKEILDLMMGRVRKSEPLYDSVLAMANGLLPTQYQRGGGGMG